MLDTVRALGTEKEGGYTSPLIEDTPVILETESLGCILTSPKNLVSFAVMMIVEAPVS